MLVSGAGAGLSEGERVRNETGFLPSRKSFGLLFMQEVDLVQTIDLLSDGLP